MTGHMTGHMTSVASLCVGCLTGCLVRSHSGCGLGLWGAGIERDDTAVI